jgi:hypothetical protein
VTVVVLSVLQGNPVTNQGHNMSERQNNWVCIFDLKSPRITAFQIHEWIYETTRNRRKHESN